MTSQLVEEEVFEEEEHGAVEAGFGFMADPAEQVVLQFGGGESGAVDGEVDRRKGGEVVKKSRNLGQQVVLDAVVGDRRDAHLADEEADLLVVDAGKLILVVGGEDDLAEEGGAVLGDVFLVDRDELLGGEGLDLFNRDVLLDDGFLDGDDVAGCIGGVETIDQVVGGDHGHVVAKDHAEPVEEGGLAGLPLAADQDQDGHEAIGVEVEDLQVADAKVVLFAEDVAEEESGPGPGTGLRLVREGAVEVVAVVDDRFEGAVVGADGKVVEAIDLVEDDLAEILFEGFEFPGFEFGAADAKAVGFGDDAEIVGTDPDVVIGFVEVLRADPAGGLLPGPAEAQQHQDLEGGVVAFVLKWRGRGAEDVEHALAVAPGGGVVETFLAGALPVFDLVGGVGGEQFPPFFFEEIFCVGGAVEVEITNGVGIMID